MSDKLEKLQGRVEDVGGLRKLHSKASGLFGVLAACGGLYLVYSVLDIALKFSRPERGAALLVVMAAVAWVAYRTLVKPLVDRLQAAQLAVEIEKHYPEVEEALSTSIEYGTDRQKAEELSSPALVDALIDDTHDRTRDLPFERTIDWGLTKRLGMAAVLVMAVAAVCMAGWPHLFGKTLLRLLNPIGDIDPPTFTVIEKVTPGDAEIARGDSVRVEVELSARIPETAEITIASGEKDFRTEKMIAGEEGRFSFSLSRVTEDMKYTIAAGDAERGPHAITVYEEPRVLDIVLRLEYPEYTGLEPREIADGLGEITALRGTKVTVKAKLNKPVSSGKLVMSAGDLPGKLVATGEGDEAEHALEAGFTVEAVDSYSIHLVDERGRSNATPPKYRITALPDHGPKVRIVRPDKEVMAFRNQPVDVEIEAQDDYGVKEMGIYHTLGGEETKLVVKKYGGAGERDATETHPLHLALKGFKGGEIIQYYAYARDNDTVDGPKETLGELHFIRTYDEEAYAPGPMQKRKKTPEAAKKVEDLIKRQMATLKKTFELVREDQAVKQAARRGEEAAEDVVQARREELERKAGAYEAEQGKIKKDLDDLLAEVEKNLPDDMRTGEDVPLEMEELRSASKKMGKAVDELKRPSTREAASREAEALRHLSEAQRLIFSEFADKNFQAAMESSARKTRQNRRKREQQEAEELEKQMAQLPPMLEREKEAERELDRLEDEEERGPGTPEKQDERRKLKRKLAEEQRKLAQQAQQSAERLQQMQKQNSQTQSAAKSMKQAASSMKQSAQASEQNQTAKAKQAAQQAKRDLEKAQRDLARSLERNLDQRLQDAKADAEELARKEEQLAREAKGAEEQKAAAEAEARKAQAAGDQKKAQEARKAGEKAAQKTASELAGKQDSLREEADSLGKEVDKVARSAKQQPLDVRMPITQANAQAASGQAQARMKESKKALEQKNMQRGAEQAREAARELDEIAERLGEALDAAQMKEAERLAKAIEKARELAEKENQLASKAARGQVGDEMKAEQEGLRKAAEELAAQAPNIKPVREAGKDREVRRAFARAGQKMRSTEKDIASRESKAAERDALEATRELRKGLEALEAASSKDLETELAKLLETAREAKEAQQRVDKAVGKAGERAAKKKPVTEPEAERAARDEARAAERTEDFAERLEAAARRLSRSRPEDDLPKEIGALRERVEDSQLPERMKQLGKLLKEAPEALKKEADARAVAQEERSLMRGIDTAARRLESLLAEAADEELRRLRAAEAEARELAKQTAELDKDVKSMQQAQKPADQPPQPGEQPSGQPGKKPVEAPNVRGMRDRAEGLADDMAFMERRLKEMKLGEKDLRRAAKARELVKEVKRALSRNQLPRPGGRLADASSDYQAIGDELMRRIEEVLKRRKITEPADETAPEEYRSLVEKYYRALSED